MRPILRRIAVRAACAVLLIGWAPEAAAFFPIGGFDSFYQLRYVKWPFSAFDTDNDGQIEANEGLDILIEGGKSGFTDEEIAVIQEALQVWQDVPTSYASFRISGVTEDPVPAGDATSPDFRTVVELEVTDEDDTGDEVVPDTIIAGVSDPTLAVTFIIFAVEDTLSPTVAGQSSMISAGTIVDMDMVFDATPHRPDPETGDPPLVDLKATVVHEVGHLLGLGHTPMNNLRGLYEEPGAGDPVGFVENQVVWMTGPDGNPGYIGATPVMFPIAFWTQLDSGLLVDGTADLAPDDISGVSWLYPRGSQANFFAIAQEARSYTRPGSGLPSIPLPGGHIVAWADVDDNPDTPRIPLFSTLAGLWEPAINEQLAGRFTLEGLWKQMELPNTDGELFDTTYSLSLNALNESGLTRQAPMAPFGDVNGYDSIQGSEESFSVSTRTDYVSGYASEVFHEAQNVTDISNHDSGTPLMWSFDRDAVISADTLRTVPDMLPLDRPMFGDPKGICPLNVIQEGASTTTTTAASLSGGGGYGPTALRRFRDKVLLQSSVGTALVDVYYQSSPVFTRFLLAHGAAFRTFRVLVKGFYWTLENAAVLALCLAAGILTWAWRGKRRGTARRIAGGLFLAAYLSAPYAAARIAYITTPEMAASADAIVTGTIVSTESRWAAGGYIVTDAVLEIAETAKGMENKGSSVVVIVPGGRIGGMVMRATDMPTFEAGEEVLLYLRERAGSGYFLHGGQRGTFVIETDAKTAQKYVRGAETMSQAALGADAKALIQSGPGAQDDARAEDGRIPLEEYLGYLRALVRDAEQQEP